jgi:F420-non-reducing hydrogenase small subunit
MLRIALQTLLSKDLPPKGTVLAPDIALCEECPRKDSKPDKLSLSAFRRPQEILIDEEKCLLAQGLICLGPATRSGCDALCVRGNMPCTGCGGPTSRVKDQGAKAVSFLGSLLDSKEEKQIDDILATIPDPVGTFYRYSVPGSLLRRKHGASSRQNVSR